MPPSDPHPAHVPFNVSKDIVTFAGNLSLGTLERLRDSLSGSLTWAGEQFGKSSRTPVAGGLGIADGLKGTSEALQAAGDGTRQGLAVAVEKTYEAFQTAFRALDQAGDLTKRTLFENVGMASVLGPSFDPFLKQDIASSFREPGLDVSPARAAEGFRASGMKEAVLMVPGLFCDEMIWHRPDPGPYDWSEFFRQRKLYPLSLRFHPGRHISDNGRDLSRLMQEFFERTGAPLNFMSYSQGGLILRSALYYAREEHQAWRDHVRKALLVACPDGGSYIEKVGFVVGNGLVAFPNITLKLIGLIGNMRSDAMKDLSHGIIREEDWMSDDHLIRYLKDYYFGELDDVDAYQAYGLVADEQGAPAWIGDGVVEQGSLKLLSDTVYRTKPGGDKRVFVIPGASHFQTLQHPALTEYAGTVFPKKIFG